MNRADNPFGLLANPLVAAGLLTLWVAVLLAFRGEPQWDLGFSRIFFDSVLCPAADSAATKTCFPLSRVPTLALIRNSLHHVPTVLGLFTLFLLLFELWAGHRWSDSRIRLETVLVSTLILGPGIITNMVLKEHWGRPRPWMTDTFGGTLPFAEAGRITDLCASNCSFVSGEGSGAGWLMCVAMMMAIRSRPWSAAAFAVTSVVMAGLRITFGAHYLSDVVLGYTMTIVLFSLFAALAEWTAARRR